MPSKSNNNQPFSVDEMMERLKTRPGSSGSRIVATEEVDGELIEVRRKRKRRSVQPKKEREKRLRRVRTLAIIGVFAVFAGLGSLYYLAKLRYQGDSFRSSISERMTEVIGLETEVRRLKVGGLSVGTQKILVKGGGTGLLHEAEMLQIMADIKTSSWFSGDWDIDKVTITDANIVLRPPSAGGAGAVGMQEPRTGRAMLMAGLGLSARPAAFNVDALRISQCNFVWRTKSEDIGDVETTFGSDVLVTSTDIGGTTKLTMMGGIVEVGGWPMFDVFQGSAELSEDHLKISDLRLNRTSFGDSLGFLDASGRIAFSADGESAFSIRVKNAKIRDFLPTYWQDKLLGLMGAEVQFRTVLSQPGSLRGEGSFTVSDAILGGLPMQQRLAAYVEKNRLTYLKFEQVKGRYRKNGTSVQLFDLEASVSDLAIRGNVEIDAKENITGVLRIGIPEKVLEGSEIGKPKFFGPEGEDGYCWVDVNISGKRDNLADDLTSKFEDAISAHREDKKQFFPDLGTKRLKSEDAKSATEQREQALEKAFDQILGD